MSGHPHGGRRGAWGRTGRIASWVLLGASMVVAGILVLPTLLGMQRYVIVSGSMEPTISVGSVVYDEVVPVGELEVGDIITFVPPAEYGIDDPVTHRIVEIGTTDDGERTFRTRGDANAAEDQWTMVLEGPDQARVVHTIAYVGYVYMLLNHGWVQLLLIGLPALAIAIYLGFALWRTAGAAVLEERERAAAEQSQEVAS
ncbi:signal peptidase I [Nocardioides sp. URHA0020]|uniref:signal peptidase I n=1 Tax=Nocardioides sp. URHA0020 TaxID=1380392 RepID=UPI000688B7AE|nr:signal peptidase I [Nocardioides sp. URHA0020]